MEQEAVCRTCLRQTKNHVSVFSSPGPELWGKKIEIAKLIMACVPIKVTMGDGLPSRICNNCLELLQLSFLYRLRALTADENFKQMKDTNGPHLIESLHKTTHLSRIYSREYIAESIQENSTLNGIKKEPKENEAPSPTVSQSTTLAENRQVQNTRSNETNTTVLGQKENVQSNGVLENVSSDELIQENSTSIRVKEEPKECEAPSPTVSQSTTLAENQQVRNTRTNETNNTVLVQKENVQSNESNGLLENDKNVSSDELPTHRSKRTYSKVSNRSEPKVTTKTPKVQNTLVVTMPKGFISGNNVKIKTNNSKIITASNSKLLTSDYDCIVIDD